MKKFILPLLIVVIFFVTLIPLMSDKMYKHTINEKAEIIYPKLLESLEKNKLIVVSEIDILDKFKHAGLPEKFGKEFNANKLTTIKTIIACNGWFGNYISNADINMMGLCPVKITLIEKDGKTTILFVKPTTVSGDSKANATIAQLEAKLISSIENIK